MPIKPSFAELETVLIQTADNWQQRAVTSAEEQMEARIEDFMASLDD